MQIGMNYLGTSLFLPVQQSGGNKHKRNGAVAILNKLNEVKVRLCEVELLA